MVEVEEACVSSERVRAESERASVSLAPSSVIQEKKRDGQEELIGEDNKVRGASERDVYVSNKEWSGEARSDLPCPRRRALMSFD